MNAEMTEPQDKHDEVVSLSREHLKEAAALFAAAYGVARQHQPSLPACHEDMAAILPKLQSLTDKEPGVASIRDGRLAGYLLGQVLPSLRGRRAVYIPEWAHAAEGEGRREMYRSMYAGLSPRWIANGCFTHLITILAGDCEAVDAFFWLEFGLTAVDAIRDLGPVQRPLARVEILRAGPDDTQGVMALLDALEQHLPSGPVFRPSAERLERETVQQRLADPLRPTWLAYRGGDLVACMHMQPGNPSAAYVINHEKTASIKAAFTKQCARRSGVGAALLDQAVDWARSAGYERCAVDFEPQNIPGTRFWLKHFRPVCYSMIRHVATGPV